MEPTSSGSLPCRRFDCHENICLFREKGTGRTAAVQVRRHACFQIISDRRPSRSYKDARTTPGASMQILQGLSILFPPCRPARDALRASSYDPFRRAGARDPCRWLTELHRRERCEKRIGQFFSIAVYLSPRYLTSKFNHQQ